MAIADILAVLTHNSGQVLNTVIQTGLGPIDAITRAVGSATAVTANVGVVFFNAFLKGLST